MLFFLISTSLFIWALSYVPFHFASAHTLTNAFLQSYNNIVFLFIIFLLAIIANTQTTNSWAESLFQLLFSRVCIYITYVVLSLMVNVSIPNVMHSAMDFAVLDWILALQAENFMIFVKLSNFSQLYFPQK